MGKTSKGALWISKDKTSPYEFYQYFLNVDDKDVVKLLKLFTNDYVEDIEELASKDIRAAKQLMAYEITKLIHGEDEANKARIEAKNQLENYTFSVRNTLRDESVAGKIPEADKKEIEKKIDEAVAWLDDHPNAEKEEYEEKQKALENAIMPIFSKMAGAGAGGMPGGMPTGGMPTGGMPTGGMNSQPQEDDGPHIEEVD